MLALPSAPAALAPRVQDFGVPGRPLSGTRYTVADLMENTSIRSAIV
jgi:hypothetical protein